MPENQWPWERYRLRLHHLVMFGYDDDISGKDDDTHWYTSIPVYQTNHQLLVKKWRGLQSESSIEDINQDCLNKVEIHVSSSYCVVNLWRFPWIHDIWRAKTRYLARRAKTSSKPGMGICSQEESIRRRNLGAKMMTWKFKDDSDDRGKILTLPGVIRMIW